MDFISCVTSRKSIRAYKEEKVAKDKILQIIETAGHAPSWANAQPWEFNVVAGATLEKIKELMEEKILNREKPNPDIPFPTFPEEHQQRINEFGKSLFTHLGLDKEGKEKRVQFTIEMHKFFNAPAVIFVTMNKELSLWSLFDLGLVVQNIALMATHENLGTCIQASTVSYPDVLRETLNIPENKNIVCGISIGYPDEKSINNFISNRVTAASLVNFFGF
ncbi:MAG: nitroreductase [Bacillota bacterium]|nr:nitroreductase [Bacillota bacterium]